MGSKRKPTKKKAPIIASETEEEVEDAANVESEDLTGKILERLPNLAKEMKTSEAEVRIDGVRWEETNRTHQPVKTGEDRFSGHSPDVIDFLRRCKTEEEALEIIDYLENRGEIKAIHAKELRNQLRSQGIRSFGTQKSWGHYERNKS